METAEGDWIALCDSDDVWHPHKLEAIEACIRSLSKCDLFFHDFYLFGPDRIVDFRGAAEGPDTIFPIFRENDISYKQMMKNHYTIEMGGLPWKTVPLYHGRIFAWLVLGPCILPSACVFRKQVVDEYGGFDPEFRSAEDMEFYLRLAKNIPFAFLDLPLTGYRIVSGGLTGNIPELMHNAMRALDKHTVHDPQTFGRHKKIIKLAIARRFGRLASYHLRMQERGKSWCNLFNGLRYNCFEKQLWKVLLASLLPHALLKSLVSRRKRIQTTDTLSS